MDFSHISSYLSSDSRSGWREKLLEASFRGVPFKVEEESAGTGRRVETHEYPNRDKPYTEDLGKVTFRPSITAYVVGDDCFDQRDRLIEALNKPGPGTLVHPTYGELKVCVDGEVRVSTSKSEGRIVRFDLKFVEAGELSYPTSGAATAQTLMSSCSALDDCISDSFSGFSIDGVADFVQNDVIGNASIMLGYVSDAMKVVDSAVSDAARLLQGDISVLLPPPSSGKNFVEQVQKMWRTGKRLYGNASDLVTMIKTLSGVSLGSDLQPRGVWKTDSKTTATATQQRNVVASTLRTTAISEAAYAVTRLPAPTTSAVMQNSAMGQATTPAQSTGWPSVTHPALNNAPAVKNTVDLPTWEELTDIRDTLNTAIDKELSRTTSDALFLALRRVKADLNADINTRLEQSARIIQRTPDEVLSGAEDIAATANAVAQNYTDIKSLQNKTQDSTTTQKGIVQLTSSRVSESETLAATAKAAAMNYADIQALQGKTNDATPTNKGIIRVSDSRTSTESGVAASSLAASQNYSDMKGLFGQCGMKSRNLGVVYTNSQSFAIFVSVNAVLSDGSSFLSANVNVDGNSANFRGSQTTNLAGQRATIAFMVPAGATYIVQQFSGTVSDVTWVEVDKK